MSQPRHRLLLVQNEEEVNPLFPIKALPDRLIVQFPDLDDSYIQAEGSNILVPGLALATDADRRIARVIDVGEATDRAGEVLTSIVKPGMRVLADPDYGDPFEWEGETYHIFRSFALTGYLPEETFE